MTIMTEITRWPFILFVCKLMAIPCDECEVIFKMLKNPNEQDEEDKRQQTKKQEVCRFDRTSWQYTEGGSQTHSGIVSLYSSSQINLSAHKLVFVEKITRRFVLLSQKCANVTRLLTSNAPKSFLSRVESRKKRQIMNSEVHKRRFDEQNKTREK
jgi:hypothetical protein